ncbi:DNA polymerase III subunit delta [Ectothiorhodospiraceae bacterium 2226]|nr:DNA polymerase III subunit delta [Ectothiorhodospiraceae bacterium 2226]
MRLRPEQLDAALRKPLAPVYVVTGDEPLQHGEACDALRRAARAQGYTEREVLTVETGFDWSRLGAAAGNLSLFGEQRLIELRVPTGKPGDAGGKALSAYAADPPADALLMVQLPKLDKRAQSTAWFRALEGAGVVVAVWPVEASRLPAWLTQRLRARGLQPTPEAAALIAERVEGNLLAAAQEVEKLALLLGEGPVDLEAVTGAVADSARYDVFGLVDAALAGDAAQVARSLGGLRGEGVEPPVVVWALARELRALHALARRVAAGEAAGQAMAQARVWDKRKAPTGAALRRLSVGRIENLLRLAARCDRVAKGAESGAPWDELLELSLGMAGVRFVPRPLSA